MDITYVHNPRVKVARALAISRPSPTISSVSILSSSRWILSKGIPWTRTLHQEDPLPGEGEQHALEHHNDVLMVELLSTSTSFLEGAQISLLPDASGATDLTATCRPSTSPGRPPRRAAADDLVQLIFAAHVQVQTDLGRAALAHQGPAAGLAPPPPLLPPPRARWRGPQPRWRPGRPS